MGYLNRLAVCAALAGVFLFSLPVSARELHQGDMLFSVGGGFSNDSYTLGGQFGYFVLKDLMPGVRYFYTHEKGSIQSLDDQGSIQNQDYVVDQHQVDAFVRYYILSEGMIFPFITADGGYLRYDQSGEALKDKGLNLWSLFGGAGVVVFFSKNFAAEVTAGWRQYLSVPQDLKDAEFDERPFEWNLGFGFYL